MNICLFISYLCQSCQLVLFVRLDVEDFLHVISSSDVGVTEVDIAKQIIFMHVELCNLT